MAYHDLIGHAPILEWLPDESLFSLVSRLDRLWGLNQSGKTAEWLFGSRGLGIHHDFPSGLSKFEELTQQSLGGAAEIARDRTLLKFYRSFLSSSASASIANMMCGSSVAHLKFQLGLITSRFRANHPLKACPECMAEDQHIQGWAYWHLEHQYPGVWWCLIHDCQLYESLYKSTGVGRFLWYLPNAMGLREWQSRSGSNGLVQSATVASLSRTTIDLVARGKEILFNTSDFYKVYRGAVEQKGWLKGDRLRLPDMSHDFVTYSSKLRHLPELAALPATKDAAKAQLGRLLRKPRGAIHPLRHIILIDWLFDGAAMFLQAYQKSQVPLDMSVSPSLNRTKHNKKGHSIDLLRDELIKLLGQGKSIRAAAITLDVDINTAMEWAVDMGHSVPRRPKKLKEDKRQLMFKMLRQGLDKQLVACKIGVSMVTVSRILRTEPGLKSEWQISRFKLTQREKRAVWEKLLNQYMRMGVKLLRSMEPSVYAWLYRNDRDWLREHSHHANEHQGSKAQNRVAWDVRDSELSKEVEKTALELAIEKPHAAIRLWQLYQRIPELKAKLDVLYRLPLTQRSIERALNKSYSAKLFDDELF
ncbi:MAG: TnsD family Tn7-like transposition protein [Candidatus Thiodiazotropha endolucinida]